MDSFGYTRFSVTEASNQRI